MAKLSLGLSKKGPAKKKKLSPIETQETLYQKALDKVQADEYIIQSAYRKENYELAAQMFEMLGDYQDAPQQAALCREKAAQAQADIQKDAYELAVRREDSAQSESEWRELEKTFRGLGDYRSASQHAQTAAQQAAVLEKQFKRKRTGIGIVLAALLVAFVIGWQSGLFHYAYGWAFMQVGAYGQARSAFESLGSLLDSEEKAVRCKYLSIDETNAGSTVTFAGTTWRILKKEDGRALMIMGVPADGETLKLITLHNYSGDVTWESSSLRAYLNNEDEFLAVFTEDERSALAVQTVGQSRNIRCGTAYETQTEDLVSILSAEEAAMYASELTSVKTDFWLRTPGSSMSTAAFRSSTGEIMYYGYPADEAQLTALPVILVDYEAALEAL